MFQRITALLGAAALVATSALFAVGCGSDEADDTTTDGTVELPAEVVEAFDNYSEAMRAADGEAMLEYVTDDFTWLSYGTNLMDAEYRANYVTAFYKSFEVTTIGERTVVGGDDEYIFATPERATTPALVDGISLVKMVKVDGVWLVAAHRFLGEGKGSG